MAGAGAKAACLLRRKSGQSTGLLSLPADASGAYRPDPQATIKLVPRPPFTEGLLRRVYETGVAGYPKEGRRGISPILRNGPSIWIIP